jgi:DNA-directed RNA polymerase subunit beta'
VLAKIPRETTKTKDITGGPAARGRAVRARKPRETAVISEIDGVVGTAASSRASARSSSSPRTAAEQREYSLPRGVHVNVQEGDEVARASR